MKKLTTSTISILACLFLFSPITFAQTTFYTTGLGTGEWSNPDSWVAEQPDSDPAGPPSAEDHVVIKHTITHFAEDGYTHTGNITIKKSGSYEIMSGFDEESVYIFAGETFSVEGSLITTADLQLQVAESDMAGVLLLQPSSLVYIGDDLILEGQAGLVVNNSACGAGTSLSDVQLRSAAAYVCGSGSFIVGEKVRAWDGTGNEFTVDHQVKREIESRVCEGFAFYSSSSDCKKESPLFSGTTDLRAGFALVSFQAELREGKTKIAWQTAKERFYDFFTVEKSQDGNIFEVAENIEAIGKHDATNDYHLLDEQPFQGVTYYRLKQTMVDGSFAYSAVVKVESKTIGGDLHLYPNPSTGSVVNIKAGNFVSQDMLTLTIRNMLGQIVKTQHIKASPSGDINHKLQHRLESGTYVLIITGTSNQKQLSQMMQVQ